VSADGAHFELSTALGTILGLQQTRRSRASGKFARPKPMRTAGGSGASKQSEGTRTQLAASTHQSAKACAPICAAQPRSTTKSVRPAEGSGAYSKSSGNCAQKALNNSRFLRVVSHALSSKALPWRKAMIAKTSLGALPQIVT